MRSESLPQGIVARAMATSDRGFVVSTWLRSAKEHARVSRDVFWAHHGRLVDRLLGDSETIVACSAERTSAVHAWACVGHGQLHWAYVPPELRHQGIARALIGVALGGYPKRIEITQRCLLKSGRYVYNPYELLLGKAA